MIKKETLKGFLIGMIVTVLLTTTVFAATGQNIEIVYGVVKSIIIDGEDKTPTEQKNMPFVYNGTTYVPVRYISESMNKKVSWDGNTGTIFIGDLQKKSSYFYKKGFAESTDMIIVREDIRGVALVNDFNWGKYTKGEDGNIKYFKESITYNLNGDVEKVEGSIDMLNEFGKRDSDNEGNKKVSGQVRIYDSNDNIVYKSEFVRLESDPIDFEIDTKNMLNIKFELYLQTPHSETGGGSIAIKDLRYY